ncbi:non-ribosomal peptide synthetase, partial [Allorhizocola rhizosphaerae]|uniref:non-ribosomal peptide synthetase n=1 Tax=Allorhizocola rhizosphaerae TaxID=1872709 RepID=UPI000E3CE779
DHDALREACAAVVARHPALSRAVADTADGPRFVRAAAEVPFTEGDHSDARVRAEIERPYDLTRGPLARFALLRAAPERHLLLFSAHHLVFDGNSKDLLVRDLAAAYAGAELAPLPEIALGNGGDPERIEFWSEVNLPHLRHVPERAEPGATVEFTMAPADIDGLTHFEVLLAAVHVVLARYGNAGMPVSLGMSTRTAETRDHIGLFVNEPVLTVAPATGSLRDYASDVRRRLRMLDRHRPVSTTRPVPALTPVSVGYRKRSPKPAFEHVEWAMFSGAARNALHVQVVEGPEGWVVSLQHSPSAIPTEAVERIGRHLRAVLHADPSADVARIELEPEHPWNDTARDYDPHATVVSLFAEQVRLRPDDIAVVDDSGQSMTYAELDEASAQLARRLPADALIAIRLRRSLPALVNMLAVMRSDSAYLPIDPDYPAARQEMVLEDARPAAILSENGLEHRTGEGVPGAAYVMYTSGSTGKPKGVVVPHAALANLLLGMAETVGSTPGDRWLALTSLAFDISGLELFLPLITGGRLVIASEARALDGRTVAELIRAQGVTHVQATPSGWRVLLESDLPDGLTALCGGEALPLDLARQLRSRVARLINVYGPTETTIWSTAGEIPVDPERVTIGRPIANTRLYIVDSALRTLPVGLWGELCIGGAGVAQGYLRRPDLTADKFVRGMYRTGDVCRWTLDGQIEFRGRSDNQLKVRGHRVEAEEIETRLREHPAVAQAAVALRGDQLAGYIVARGAPPEPAELRRHLAATLPTALIPGLWQVLEALPLTANGKLDRAALPAISLPRDPVSDVDTGGDSDEIIKALQDIWQEVLSIDDIGPEEDLFDLGGHSLTITRISGRIVQRLGVEVPLDVFFDTPTIAEIALYIRESSS